MHADIVQYSADIAIVINPFVIQIGEFITTSQDILPQHHSHLMFAGLDLI